MLAVVEISEVCSSRKMQNRNDGFSGRPRGNQKTRYDSAQNYHRRNRPQNFQPNNQRRQRNVYFENSGDRRNRQPNRNNRKIVENVDAEHQWFKVTIPHGSKSGKEFLLRSLHTMCDRSFVAYNYIHDGQSAVFYVKGQDISDAIRSCSRRIVDPNGFTLTILTKRTDVPFTTLNPAIVDHLREAMGRRYDVTSKVLDLTTLHDDQYLGEQGLFVPLSRSNVLKTVFDVISDKIPDLLGLNLSDNRISELDPFGVLIRKSKSLKSLNLSKNLIRNLNDLDRLKGLDLEELILKENPCTAQIKDDAAYISSIRSRFPKIRLLDGEVLPAPIGFDVGESATLPPSLGGFIPEDIKDFVLGFVSEYFNLYDSEDRSGLSNAYHDNAVFSLCIGVTNRGESYFPSAMFQESRNLLRVKTPSSRAKFLKQGKSDIVSKLQSFPKTKHEADSFTIDSFVCGPGLINVVIVGVYRETTNRNELQTRAFCRNFLIIPNLIINDVLSLTNVTVEQIQKYGKTATNSRMMVQTSSSSLDGMGTVPAAEYVNQGQMVKRLSEMTGMNRAYSLRCLEEQAFDLNVALQVFQALKAQGGIPADAFVEL